MSCQQETAVGFRSVLSRAVFEMPRLSSTERERAIGMLQGRISVAEIAKRLNCTRSTIYSLRNRLQQTGLTSDRLRSGQPRVTTQRQDVFIRRRDHLNRFQKVSSTARQVVGLRGQVFGSTVRRRLRAAGLHARRPYVGPVLTRLHRQRRMQWAAVHSI